MQLTYNKQTACTRRTSTTATSVAAFNKKTHGRDCDLHCHNTKGFGRVAVKLCIKQRTSGTRSLCANTSACFNFKYGSARTEMVFITLCSCSGACSSSLDDREATEHVILCHYKLLHFSESLYSVVSESGQLVEFFLRHARCTPVCLVSCCMVATRTDKEHHLFGDGVVLAGERFPRLYFVYRPCGFVCSVRIGSGGVWLGRARGGVRTGSMSSMFGFKPRSRNRMPPSATPPRLSGGVYATPRTTA